MLRFRSCLVAVTLVLGIVLLAACANAAPRLTIEGKDDRTFTPDTITINTGQKVELTLVNRGKLAHTFTVPDLNIEVQMPPGETNTITFTAPAAGVNWMLNYDKSQG